MVVNLMDKKVFSLGFALLFIFLSFYLYTNHDMIVKSISQNGLQGLFWYVLSNPVYILLFISIVFINKGSNTFKMIIATLALIIAMDIVGMPRFSPTSLTQDTSFLASSDGIIINKLISYGISYSTTYTIYYLILPILLILLALYLFGYADFFKRLVGK